MIQAPFSLLESETMKKQLEELGPEMKKDKEEFERMSDEEKE